MLTTRCRKWLSCSRSSCSSNSATVSAGCNSHDGCVGFSVIRMVRFEALATRNWLANSATVACSSGMTATNPLIETISSVLKIMPLNLNKPCKWRHPGQDLSLLSSLQLATLVLSLVRTIREYNYELLVYSIREISGGFSGDDVARGGALNRQ